MHHTRRYFKNVRIIESFEFNLRNEVYEMSYLVADRIAGGKMKHQRHKGNAYPHENRLNNTFSVLLGFYSILGFQR